MTATLAPRRVRAAVAAALASLGLGAGALFPGSSAHASDAQVSIASPGAGSLSGTVRVTADASALTGLRSFRVTLSAADGSMSHRVEHGPWDILGAPGDDTISFDWNTYSFNGRTLRNGEYRVVAAAETQVDGEGDAETATVSGILVNNAPATPSGVKATLVENLPAVSWNANPEPDLVEYRIFRAVNGGAFGQVAVTKATSFSESSAEPGAAYAYKVQAVRRSPVGGNNCGTLICSSQSSASNAVTVPQPPPPPSPSPGPTEPPTGGVAVTPSQSPDGSRQPVALPAASPSPVAPVSVQPVQVQGPRRDVGFAPLLPYQRAIPTQETFEEEPQEAATESGEPPVVLSTSETPGASAVDKLPFLAAAMLLLVGSLHIARAARRLFSGGPGMEPAETV